MKNIDLIFSQLQLFFIIVIHRITKSINIAS
jgi:hypothetical protein